MLRQLLQVGEPAQRTGFSAPLWLNKLLLNRRGTEEDTSVRGFPPLKKVSISAEKKEEILQVTLKGLVQHGGNKQTIEKP